ncbi:protein EXORDIUM [Salix suchowensis]|nr:protein EXORDIUM [Salix suchowensis]
MQKKLREGHVSLAFSVLFVFFGFSWSQDNLFNQAKNYEGSSDLVDLQYHMGLFWLPLSACTLSGMVDGTKTTKLPLEISSIPSLIHLLTLLLLIGGGQVRLYTDQTGSNVTGNIVLSGEFSDSRYSHGGYLSRLAMQSIIKSAVNAHPRPLPLNPHNGLYLVLTSGDVQVQDFCRAVCGFHYFTFSNHSWCTVPYAWVGYSGTQCLYSGKPPPSTNGGNNIMRAPNGDPGVDGMISVLAHELAEVSSNPLINAWYAGDDLPRHPR